MRGRPAVERVRGLRDRGDTACTSPVNVEELVRGLRPEELDAATRLVAGLVVLPLGSEEAWRAGTWRRELSARGITLSQADCLVAAVAASARATLATGNPRHFPMDEVRLEEWPVGT